MFVNPFNIVHWVHDTWSHCKKLFLISKAVGTMSHNSAAPLQPTTPRRWAGPLAAGQTSWPRATNKPMAGKPCREKERIQQKANWTMSFYTASLANPPAAASKHLHLEQLNSQISLFLYRVSSQMLMAVSHTSLLPSTEGKQRGNSTATSPGSSSSHTREFHLEQAENFGS